MGTASADDRTGQAPAHPGRVVAVHLVRGGLALTFGLAALLFGTDTSQLATFLALYAIAAGAVTLQWAALHRGLRSGRLAIAIGLLWLGTGAAILLRGPLEDLIGEAALLDLFGVVALGTGIIRMVGWYHDDALARDRPRSRYRYVMGPLDVWLGLTVLLAHDHTSAWVRTALGLWGLAAGAFLIIDGLAVRRAARTSRTGSS